MRDSSQTLRSRWWLRLQELLLIGCCVGVSLASALPPATVDTPPPDFSALETQSRKQAFFDYLRPILTDVNEAAAADRDFAAHVDAAVTSGAPLSLYERSRLRAIAARYEIDMNGSESPEAIARLRRRTGTVPPALALIQAAKESGWGTSRFAVQGNNLFGQRCYESDCGIRPRSAPADADWGVAQFDTVRESLESYVLNLNTHPNYRDFREQRESMRAKRETLSGHDLAAALETYSERGPAYVAEIQAMIRQNSLE